MKALPLILEPRDDGKPIWGVGPGVGLAFVQHYFPETEEVIRIASAYFRLSGYKLGQAHVPSGVHLRILVGLEEGRHAQLAIVKEIIAELGRCEVELWEAVSGLVQRMEQGRFIIRDAGELENPFHCKFYITDDRLLWHGSSNFTRRGLLMAGEQISSSRNTKMINDFSGWFDEAMEGSRDIVLELLEQLREWLSLAKPFDAYLKVLASLNGLHDEPLLLGAHAPTYFQKGVIGRAIRQVDEFGGALIIAATGLGKTIMGSEIAWRMQLAESVKRAILLAPKGVCENWADHLDVRDVTYKYFNTDLLFSRTSGKPHHQVAKLDKALSQSDNKTLILIDEAHLYRNELFKEEAKGKESPVFRRLKAAVKRGARIVMLTATAYGTSLQNLNSLLALLPEDEEGEDGAKPWQVRSSDEFTNLPMVTILGLPHVIEMARSRGDVDENNRIFIKMGNERRYLPKSLKLNTVRYKLPFQDDVLGAFNRRCFNQAVKVPQSWFDDETLSTRKGVTDSVARSTLLGWLSSPAELSQCLVSNLHTNDFSENSSASLRQKGRNSSRNYSYMAPMQLGIAERTALLNPMLQKLTGMSLREDDKLQKLQEIIQRHCMQAKGKVIIFVNRHFTAAYLADALDKLFRDEVSIGSTIEEDLENPTLKSKERRLEILKDFSPNSHQSISESEYDILICTDADGIGVNLEDSATIVNYDPPEGADVLFQRVGRVLRLTKDSNRTIFLYTLVPAIIYEEKNLSLIRDRIVAAFNRITQRHEKSKKILGADVHTNEETVDVTLDSDLDVELLLRDEHVLEDVGGLGAKQMLVHVSTLEKHRRHLQHLPDYMLSALTYRGTHRRVFVLVRKGESYFPILYNLSKGIVEQKAELEVLDLIACAASETAALVAPPLVELAANDAVRKWCELEQVPLEHVIKVCSIFLLPKRTSKTLPHLLGDRL